MNSPTSSLKRGFSLKWPIGALSALAGLWLVVRMHALGEPLWALSMLLLLCIALYIYLSAQTKAARYLFPGLAAMGVFVLFPLLLTLRLSTTNFSASNLLSAERATAYLVDQRLRDEAKTYEFSVHRSNEQIRIALRPESETDTPRPASFVTPLLSPNATSQTTQAKAFTGSEADLGASVPLRDLVDLRTSLAPLSIALPDGSLLSYSGLREFAVLTPVWKPQPDGSLVSAIDARSYRPNPISGFFEDAQQNRLQPGFTVSVGLKNYLKIVTDGAIRGPFFSIFLWTVAFAALSVGLSCALGMSLAVLLNWEALKGRGVYRTFLFLPYAVPGFISILVFKGLFNQNFGEINMILNSLFGIKPSWFADPILAKVMLLIVNVWLGYAYFMVLCSGLLQSISGDLYEASALSGAGPWTNFTRITAPQIIGPLTPLLISAFAFNFNNFVLVALLTDGRPDFLNTTVPAGTTDILVSYTYRIAFKDAGADFGLAASISTLIFAMVAMMALAQLKLNKAKKA